MMSRLRKFLIARMYCSVGRMNDAMLAGKARRVAMEKALQEKLRQLFPEVRE